MMLGQKKIDRGFAGILKKNSLKIFFRAKKNETKKYPPLLLLYTSKM